LEMYIVRIAVYLGCGSFRLTKFLLADLWFYLSPSSYQSDVTALFNWLILSRSEVLVAVDLQLTIVLI
jgi:hypothetical protein